MQLSVLLSPGAPGLRGVSSPPGGVLGMFEGVVAAVSSGPPPEALSVAGEDVSEAEVVAVEVP